MSACSNYMYVTLQMGILHLYDHAWVRFPDIPCQYLRHGATAMLRLSDQVRRDGAVVIGQNMGNLRQKVAHHGVVPFNIDTLWLFNSSPWYRWPIYR